MKSTKIRWAIIFGLLVIVLSINYFAGGAYAEPADNEKLCYYQAEFSRGVSVLRDLSNSKVGFVVIGGEKYRVPDSAEQYKKNIEKQSDNAFTKSQLEIMYGIIDYVWAHPEMSGDEMFESYYHTCADKDHTT